MKKLMVLMIVMSFLVMGSGSAFADDPANLPLDRNAVWSKWFDDSGNRIPGTVDVSGASSKDEQKVSHWTTGISKMTRKGAEFDFIHETKVYDYGKDRGNSA